MTSFGVSRAASMTMDELIAGYESARRLNDELCAHLDAVRVECDHLVDTSPHAAHALRALLPPDPTSPRSPRADGVLDGVVVRRPADDGARSLFKRLIEEAKRDYKEECAVLRLRLVSAESAPRLLAQAQLRAQELERRAVRAESANAQRRVLDGADGALRAALLEAQLQRSEATLRAEEAAAAGEAEARELRAELERLRQRGRETLQRLRQARAAAAAAEAADRVHRVVLAHTAAQCVRGVARRLLTVSALRGERHAAPKPPDRRSRGEQTAGGEAEAEVRARRHLEATVSALRGALADSQAELTQLRQAAERDKRESKDSKDNKGDAQWAEMAEMVEGLRRSEAEAQRRCAVLEAAVQRNAEAMNRLLSSGALPAWGEKDEKGTLRALQRMLHDALAENMKLTAKVKQLEERGHQGSPSPHERRHGAEEHA